MLARVEYDYSEGVSRRYHASANPLTYIDPYGLWDWPSLPQSFVNASAGLGDVLLLNQGIRIRNALGISGGVNECSSGYKVGIAAGIIGTIVSGEGEVQVAERLITSEGALRTTQTVADQLAGARSYIPVQSILDTVSSGTRIPDPQGVANQFLYTAEAAYNSSRGTLEVLVNEATNTITHVLYRSGP
jgi:hypothetical protein